jgi:hypothetical protein
MDKISESGLVGADGRLRMPMDRLNAFFAKHKGERVIVRFESAERGSSAAQLAYYYNYIVPTVQQAFKEIGERKSEQATDRFLLSQYPGDKSESEIGFGVDVLEARFLSNDQMRDFLEWLKQYAAENLYVYIEDPKTL